MDRYTFLDAQLWLRRVEGRSSAWSASAPTPLRQLLPPSSSAESTIKCCGCFELGDELCYFAKGDGDEDQTVLSVELAIAGSALVIRFDRECEYEISRSSIRSIVLPLESQAAAGAPRLPPFGVIVVDNLSLRLWLEPCKEGIVKTIDYPADAGRLLGQALQCVQGLQGLQVKSVCSHATDSLSSTVYRHNRWLTRADDNTRHAPHDLDDARRSAAMLLERTSTKWQSYDTFLHGAVAATRSQKRQKTRHPTGCSEDSNLVDDAARGFTGAVLEQVDLSICETAAADGYDTIRAVETGMFTTLFPMKPAASSQLQSSKENPVSSVQDKIGPACTERILNDILESRRALIRQDLAVRCLPHRHSIAGD